MTNKKRIQTTSLFALTSAILLTSTILPALNTQHAFAGVIPPEGTIIGDFDSDVGAVGLGFDGQFLYVPNGLTSNELIVFDTNGNPQAPLNLSCDVGNISYDPTRGVFWGYSISFGPADALVYTINPLTGQCTFQFDALPAMQANGDCGPDWNCMSPADGIDYDERDDTIRISPDGSKIIYNFNPDGTLASQIGPIDTTVPCGFDFSSGVATGASNVMYTATGGCDEVFKWDKDTGVKLGSFTIDAARNEGMECDSVTFSDLGTDAIWVKDLNGPIQAFAVPQGTCEIIPPTCTEENGVTICKTADISDPADTVYRVGEIIVFDFSIVVTTSSTTLTNVEVKDRLGGDLMSFENSLVSTDNLTCTLGNPVNNGGHEKGGKTKKEFLDCNAIPNGELEPQSIEEINFSAKTDVNPGQQNRNEKNGKEIKNEYTSCGLHEANSGATIEFWFFGQDPEVDEPTELKTPSITVAVFDESYPDSDCDKDGVDDPVDMCPFEGLEVFGEVDQDGCPVED
jgi:hypothetical protein